MSAIDKWQRKCNLWRAGLGPDPGPPPTESRYEKVKGNFDIVNYVFGMICGSASAQFFPLHGWPGFIADLVAIVLFVIIIWLWRKFFQVVQARWRAGWDRFYNNFIETDTEN